MRRGYVNLGLPRRAICTRSFPFLAPLFNALFNFATPLYNRGLLNLLMSLDFATLFFARPTLTRAQRSGEEAAAREAAETRRQLGGSAIT